MLPSLLLLTLQSAGAFHRIAKSGKGGPSMDWLSNIRRLLGGAGESSTAKSAQPPLVAADDDEPEPFVPEMDAAYLRSALALSPAPFVLDIREPFEWRQVRMPGALHIPMNSIPDRLDDLPRDRPIAVMCAHGNRSYGVTAYLREQGFDAHNLTGGITRWRIEGGEVEAGAP